MRTQRRRAVSISLLVALACAAVPAAVAVADHDDPDAGKPENAIVKRTDRYVPKPAGTEEKVRYYFGPYTVPPGHDANRVDIDLPLANGYITSVEPGLRRAQDFGEPSRQEAHIHHAHWFAADPGNEEDNYTGGNTEWIFGNGDEETKADFSERSAADPKGPIYGQYIGAQGPQLMIYMLHNKTSQPLNVYVALDVTFLHGTKQQLATLDGREVRDVSGVLFGRTFDVPREPAGDGVWSTTTDHPRKAIEWTATKDGTIIGTGGHLHPGGTSVLVENMGSAENPCPDDGRGTGGTLMLKSDALFNKGVKFSEDFQMEVSNPGWRAPVRKGDRIRITGLYENRDHAWYTAMTHAGLYIDEAAKPQGDCRPVLVNQAPPGTERVKKRAFVWKRKRYRDRKTGRVKVKLVKKYLWTVKRKKVRSKKTGRIVVKKVRVKKYRWVSRAVAPPDATEGVPNRPWSVHAEAFCGVDLGGPPCERPEEPRPAGQYTDTVTIANFLYLPGDLSLPDEMGAPPKVKQGKSLAFFNADQAAGIRHSVTTCRWPCNGRYVANYPLADGVWDSTTLGYDPIDGGNPNPVARTPTDLKPGKYSYYCRIHPWMRGAFEVTP